MENKIDRLSFKIQDDLPESNAVFFNFDAYSKVLASIIQSKETNTPLVIGVFGDWGSGKTSLMKTIESRIKGLFFAEDIDNSHIVSLVHKLCDKKNNISLQLLKLFHQKSCEELRNFDNKYYEKVDLATDQEIGDIKKILITEFNSLLENPSILNRRSLPELDLTEKTRKLIRKNSRRKEDIIRLNRLILTDIFPDEIKNPQNNINGYSVRTIWFNAWKYEQKEDIWREFLMRILEELKLEEIDTNYLKTKDYSKLFEKILFTKKYLKDYFFGYEISREDISDPNNLFFKLSDEDNPLSQYLYEKFSPDMREILKFYKLNIDPPFEEHQKHLVNELNRIIKGPNLYDEEIFNTINLTDETKRLANKKNLKGISVLWFKISSELCRLNNQLLVEAYLNKSLNQNIEDLQESLYHDIDREEPFDIEFKPSKLVKGTIKLGIKSGFSVPMGGILSDFFGKDEAFNDLLDTVSVNKRKIHIKQIQLVEEFQRSFQQIIEEYYWKNNERVIIFIDDLDRCPFEKVLEILQSIKLFLDVKNCVFILGIDRRIISKIIENKYKDILTTKDKDVSITGDKDVPITGDKDVSITGDNYLEKLIQLNFNLPPIDPYSMCDFVTLLGVDKLYEEYLTSIISESAIDMNPRKIKRLLNFIELQLQIARSIPNIQSEISNPETTKLYSLLIIEWSIIDQEYPKLKYMITKKPETLYFIHKYIAIDPQTDDDKKKIQSIEDHLTFYLGKDKMQELIKGNNALKNLIKAFPSSETKKFLDDNKESDIVSVIKNVIHFSRVTSATANPPKKYEEQVIAKEETSEERMLRKDNEIKSEEETVPSDIKSILKVIESGKKEFEGINCSGANMVSFNLEGFTIKDSYFIGTNMAGINLRNAKIENSVFDRAKLNDAHFEGEETEIKNSKFLGATLSGIDLRNATIENSVFDRAILSDANFEGENTKILGSKFIGANMTGVSLKNATISHSRFDGAILNDANFEGDKTKITSSIFIRAQLNRAKLSNINLEGADLRYAKLWYASLKGVKFIGAKLNDSELFDADLERADLSKANLTNAGLMRANLSETTLSETEFRNANLRYVKFKNTDLTTIGYNNVTLDNLVGSNWEDAKWDKDAEKDIQTRYVKRVSQS